MLFRFGTSAIHVMQVLSIENHWLCLWFLKLLCMDLMPWHVSFKLRIGICRKFPVTHSILHPFSLPQPLPPLPFHCSSLLFFMVVMLYCLKTKCIEFINCEYSIINCVALNFTTSFWWWFFFFFVSVAVREDLLLVFDLSWYRVGLWTAGQIF